MHGEDHRGGNSEDRRVQESDHPVGVHWDSEDCRVGKDRPAGVRARDQEDHRAGEDHPVNGEDHCGHEDDHHRQEDDHCGQEDDHEDDHPGQNHPCARVHGEDQRR